METKHTSGPWSWDDAVWTEYDPAERAPWLVDSNGDPVLTGVIHCKSEHDAHLIAAAPELLAALKTAAVVIGHPEDSFSVYMARLIAKATGEA